MLFVANDLKQALQIWVLARASHLGLEDKSSLQPQVVLHEIRTNQLAKVIQTQEKRHEDKRLKEGKDEKIVLLTQTVALEVTLPWELVATALYTAESAIVHLKGKYLMPFKIAQLSTNKHLSYYKDRAKLYIGLCQTKIFTQS